MKRNMGCLVLHILVKSKCISYVGFVLSVLVLYILSGFLSACINIGWGTEKRDNGNPKNHNSKHSMRQISYTNETKFLNCTLFSLDLALCTLEDFLLGVNKPFLKQVLGQKCHFGAPTKTAQFEWYWGHQKLYPCSTFTGFSETWLVPYQYHFSRADRLHWLKTKGGKEEVQ